MGNVCCGPPSDDSKFLADSNRKLYRPVNYQQRIEDILDFWFRGDNDTNELTNYDRETSLPQAFMLRWFRPNEEFREIVKFKFEEDFQRLQSGMYKEWEASHDGRLALIILSDQLSRSFYHDQKQQFMFDHISLGIAKRLAAKQSEYKKYKLIERLFILFPFMHSENLQDCEMSIKLIKMNIEYSEQRHYDQVTKQFNGLLKSAEQFVLILKCFGRFPHRNHFLGRKNTPEEEKYLSDGKLPVTEQKATQPSD